TSPTTVQVTTPTSKLPNAPSTPETTPTTVKVTTSTTPGNTQPAHTTSVHPSQQVSSSASSGASPAASAASPAAPAATSRAAQRATSPAASLGSSAATTATSPVLTHKSSTSTTSQDSVSAVTSPSNVEAQRSQLPTTIASTGVPRSNLPPGSSPTSVTKQPHSSTTSAVPGLASSIRPGSINTSVAPSDGSVSHTTSKVSPSLPPGGAAKVSEAATTSTPGEDHRSPGAGSVPTKPASADQSPASTQPAAPAPGEQPASSSPGRQHHHASFQNEILCEDQQQNTQPTIYLREAKTCDEWRAASANTSFYENFCSTGQHAFNASRGTCTVTFSSSERRSKHWAVRVVVHLPLDPKEVFEMLKEKDKLEELGIANTTYDKMESEMIINDEFSTPLIITIVTLAGSLLLIAAIYGCCHQRFSQKKDQHIHPDLPGFDDGHVALIFNQRLTEELQTMENGYHDNPTLEVMETSSEMQEKKVNLNGELGDSWIVPLDTLMKEDLEEEDTHL
ncbi:PREDICTED: podocalyxin, partial [Buceros rhinoceros silvestris]|uniref:podocalyxin n=1 Tax=Buceros rhinoceros silvestris TaxID=175836 RepID=UPI000528E565